MRFKLLVSSTALLFSQVLSAETFTVDVWADNWFQFIYGGNTNLGNKTFDRDLIAMMSMELGLDGEHYFRPGEARLDIRKIRLISERS